MNLLEEIIKSSIFAICGTAVAAISAALGMIAKMYLDIREMKKDLGAAFCKLREIEKHKK